MSAGVVSACQTSAALALMVMGLDTMREWFMVVRSDCASLIGSGFCPSVDLPL
jgi:hypothetical protein